MPRLIIDKVHDRNEKGCRNAACQRFEESGVSDEAPDY